MTCLIDISDFDEDFFEKIKEAENKISMSDKEKKSKNASLCGRVLLGYMLKRNFGLEYFCYRYGENEKPYLENEDIFFNISHSGNYVLCSVDRREIGCDVQALSPYNKRVADRFFARDEFDLLETVQDKDRPFIKIWALKESILKKLGTGITGGLSDYDFSSFIDCDSFSAYGCRFSCFHLEDAEISVCSEQSRQELEIITKDEFEAYIDGIKL